MGFFEKIYREKKRLRGRGRKLVRWLVVPTIKSSTINTWPYSIIRKWKKTISIRTNFNLQLSKNIIIINILIDQKKTSGFRMCVWVTVGYRSFGKWLIFFFCLFSSTNLPKPIQKPCDLYKLILFIYFLLLFTTLLLLLFLLESCFLFKFICLTVRMEEIYWKIIFNCGSCLIALIAEQFSQSRLKSKPAVPYSLLWGFSTFGLIFVLGLVIHKLVFVVQ